MAETTPRGIQATLFDYFQDTEYFSIEEAKELVIDQQSRDVNRESIRARIYEGIEKGLFERVGKGLYTVTRTDDQGKENTCLLINGDGRDLSMIPSNSISAILTDHPYKLTSSLKGGNRNFADYDLFQYTEKDMAEKSRVLKPGHFAVEFLPEENADNYQYLFAIKQMAKNAGLEYYAKVNWVKGDFVANTGRKSKNIEDICFFTKGCARELRPDAKKDKQYANSRTIVSYEEYIPGSKTIRYNDMGGMPSSYETETEPIDISIRISVAKEDKEKAEKLLDDAFMDSLLFDNSPLDIDNGGKYTYDELDEMPKQEYMMKYIEVKGLSFVDLSPGPKNIFKAQTQVLVNPTNLIGPMGAGLAKEFKNQYPGLEEQYRNRCKLREQSNAPEDFLNPMNALLSVSPAQIITSNGTIEKRALYEGDLYFFVGGPDENRPSVLCFPTKRDWKDPSSLELIEEGLKTFVREYKSCGITSITFPKLGCGLGGLDWEKEVKPLMQKYLANLPDLDVQICGDTLREDTKENFMSGAHGMLPSQFNVAPPGKKEKIHQAEKPTMLLEQILQYVTLPGETALDQFAGSGVLGEAALNTGRNAILIEKDVEAFQKLSERLSALGKLEAITPAAQALVTIGADAIMAQDAFKRTGDRNILYDFERTHKIDHEQLNQGEKELWNTTLTKEERDCVGTLYGAIEEMDLGAQDLDLDPLDINRDADAHMKKVETKKVPKILECSSRGDRRFSALFAKIKIRGKERSIEEFYQDAKRTADGKKAGKGKPFDHIVDPYTGDKLPAKEAPWLYRGLWISYLTQNPDLVEYASKFDEFTNCFGKKGLENSPEEVIYSYVKGGREHYVATVKASDWYKNIASKAKASLTSKIQGAKTKANTMQNGQSHPQKEHETVR